MPQVLTDGAIIERSLRDPDAFSLIFERHYDSVRRYAQRRTGGSAGEDIASETFVQGFRTRHRFETGNPRALPWLLGIATNLVRHHFRDEERTLAAYARAFASRARSELERGDHVEYITGLQAVSQALIHLPSGQRDVLLLHAWADLSYRDIAAALGLPIGTVRSRLNKARRKLRELLDSEQATTIGEREPTPVEDR